ncbi:hypothetical protein NUH88_19085 [Nisaea acidiphila]|uniref:Uncharacterized protein n=1 Tax=Nisaea acidiphila TaxID=1862145 RepID=A0A9J7AT35_9PROT|nr:hypothetical protein [Nisaea acidiphila]UUX49492.1 hypothetical protein NUH88_19085 [Nisaea acidiphila]
MDKLERKSLKILADSTRESHGDSDLTRNLEAAAKTGNRDHYDRARDTFESLPPEQKRTIGAGAVSQAETVKVKMKRRKAAAKPAPQPEDPGAVSVDWLLGKSEEGPKAPPKTEAKYRDRKKTEPTQQAALPDEEEGGWNWKALPDDPLYKKNGAKDPLQELREQMLGSGQGTTWRRSLPSGEQPK